MIRKLRTKLVAAAMLSLLAVLTVILGVILLTNYRGIVSDADRILDLLADNQGKFPEIKADFDWEELGPRHRSEELGYETRYFSVLLDRQGTVLATDTGKIAAVDEETAASSAQAVWAQDSPRGFWQDYRYLEAREGENTRVIFLDYGAHLFTFHSTLVTSLWVAASGLLAVLLLLFMPFSLLSLTGELPLPTRNAPICQTLLCISIPLLVIGAFSSLLLLLPKLLIPSACVWLFGGALMLFLPPGAFRKSRMAMYWAVICFAAVVALLMMLLQRYQAYGDLYEGLSYDILRVMMNARTRPQVLYSAYVSGLAALDAKRTAALESLAALTGGNVLPWLSEDVLQQLEWSLRATIERTLPSIMPDLLVKGIMAFSLGMLLCWRKFPDAEDTPSADRWFMPTPLGISMAVLLLLSAAQLFTTNATVALAASLLGSVAFWSFAVQGVSAQNFAMIRAGATRGRRWFLTILMVLFVPILPMFAGCVDQIRDPRRLRDDRHRKDDDFSDF